MTLYWAGNIDIIYRYFFKPSETQWIVKIYFLFQEKNFYLSVIAVIDFFFQFTEPFYSFGESIESL